MAGFKSSGSACTTAKSAWNTCSHEKLGVAVGLDSVRLSAAKAVKGD